MEFRSKIILAIKQMAVDIMNPSGSTMDYSGGDTEMHPKTVLESACGYINKMLPILMWNTYGYAL